MIPILLAAVALAVFTAIRLLPDAGDPAPAITLTTLDGRRLSVNELRGKVVLVTFWATTCPPCVKEIPHLVELYQALNRQGLEIIAVAMSYDPPSYVAAMVQRRRIPYPVALDPEGEAARAFGDVRQTPTSILIAPDGRIAAYRIGSLNRERLRAAIEQMLNPPPGGGRS